MRLLAPSVTARLPTQAPRRSIFLCAHGLLSRLLETDAECRVHSLLLLLQIVYFTASEAAAHNPTLTDRLSGDKNCGMVPCNQPPCSLLPPAVQQSVQQSTVNEFTRKANHHLEDQDSCCLKENPYNAHRLHSLNVDFSRVGNARCPLQRKIATFSGFAVRMSGFHPGFERDTGGRPVAGSLPKNSELKRSLKPSETS